MRYLNIYPTVAGYLLLASPVLAQDTSTIETGIMPTVTASSTRVLVLPSSGGPQQSGGRVTAAYDEVKYQFSIRGFQVLPESSTSIDFSNATNRTLENFVKVGKSSNADFVSMIYVDKVKTFAFYEYLQPKIWFRLPGRQPWLTPSNIFTGMVGGLFNFAPNQKYGSTIYTYVIDVKNEKAVLFNHKNYGNSEGFVLGSSKSKWGTSGAVQDSAMFIMSRTLKDYPKTK